MNKRDQGDRCWLWALSLLVCLPLMPACAEVPDGAASAERSTTASSRSTGEPSATSEVADDIATDGPYEQRRATRDGTGKVYLGREIAQVMGHLGAGWLERPGREREERTDLLVQRLPVTATSVVADIGAGTGYFSFAVAERVSQGRVLAVDIQPEMLALLSAKARTTRVTNVEPVLGTVTDPRLGSEAVDLAFIVDAYHEFSHPLEMGQALARALKPGGKLVLVEYRAEDRTVPIKPLHKMTEAQVRREMAAVGLSWVETESYLPQQHVLVFEKPPASGSLD